MIIIQVSRVFYSRTGRKYKVGARDKRGLTIRRLGNGDAVEGKPLRVTWRKIQKTADVLLTGKSLSFQTNASKGGISYTVAEESAIVFAMGNLVITDSNLRMFHLNPKYDGPTNILEIQGAL